LELLIEASLASVMLPLTVSALLSLAKMAPAPLHLCR